MDSYNKIWSVIRNTDLLNGDEKIELHLYLMNLNEHDKKQKEVIDKAIKLIEDDYYSKNTTDIDNIAITFNKLLKVRSVLKEVNK